MVFVVLRLDVFVGFAAGESFVPDVVLSAYDLIGLGFAKFKDLMAETLELAMALISGWGDFGIAFKGTCAPLVGGCDFKLSLLRMFCF